MPLGGGGYVVLTRPWPGMLRGIWGDDERYVQTYWSKFPHLYFAGDGCRRDADGNFWFMGRIDDVMNVSGHRISTTEVESALVDHPTVAEAAVCGKLDEMTGQAIYAFVSLKGGARRIAGARRRAARSRRRRSSASSRARNTSRSRTSCPRRAAARSCAACCATSPKGRTLGDTTTLADSSVVHELQERAQSRGRPRKSSGADSHPSRAFLDVTFASDEVPAYGVDAGLDEHRRWPCRHDVGFRQAYRRYAPLLYSAAYNVLANAEEAQDCVHDALARLASPHAYSAARGNSASFLVVCVRNEAISRRRRKCATAAHGRAPRAWRPSTRELRPRDPIERDRVRSASPKFRAEQRTAARARLL